MNKTQIFKLSAGLLLAAASCRPRADGSAKIEHPAIVGKIDHNEIEWNDPEPFGLSRNVYRNSASLVEMNQDKVCFEVVLSGFDDDAAAELERAGFVLYLDDNEFKPDVEQLVAPHKSTHMGKKTQWETVDTGLRNRKCVDGTRDSQGNIINCTQWNEEKVTQTRSYDIPMEYTVVQGAGKACFSINGQVKPEKVEHVLLEIQNAKSEKTSAFWGIRYKHKTRLRWDLAGDVPKTIGAKWGGTGGSDLIASAKRSVEESDTEEGADKSKSKEKETEEVADTSPPAKVGIAACDAYIDKMMKCAETMPEAARKPMLDGARQSADGFKQGASNKATRPAIEKACKSAAVSLETTCKATAGKGGGASSSKSRSSR